MSGDSPELAGETVALRDIVGARNRQRRALRQTLAQRQRSVEQLLAFRGAGESRPATDGEELKPAKRAPLQEALRKTFKRYRNE